MTAEPQRHGPALLHVATPSLSVVEGVLAAGYDGVVVDLQHGEVGLEAACVMLRAIPRGTEHAYARVSSIDSGAIGRLLDSGARGIVAPTVESAEEARTLVAAAKYPPLGRRSLGPSRPALYDGADYCAAGNAAVAAVVQIETRLGVERADEILAVEGVDSVYLGPADLAVSYGLPGRADWEAGPVLDAIETVTAAARRHGRTVGLYCASAGYAAALLERGLVDYVGLGIDLVLVTRAARDLIEQLKGTP